MENQKFGRYTIREEIGRGGMASVYLADDPSFDRVVAIKVLPREYLHDPLFRARFEREAKTIAKLEHAAIVPVYDYGEQDGQLYLVMRYMQGGSLAQRLEAGAITPDETASIIRRLAPALDRAHSQGIIHRDLKPGNILFDEDRQAYLADFGIARWVEATANLTGGGIVGTPAYMSPEQVQGDQALDGRSDQYSLAVIVFEMLTGQKPYDADTPAKVLMKHILEPVPDLETTRRGLPTPLGPALTRALSKKREDRFSDTGEFANTLAAGLAAGLSLQEDIEEPTLLEMPTRLAPPEETAAQTIPAPPRPAPSHTPPPTARPAATPSPTPTPPPAAYATGQRAKPGNPRLMRTLIIFGVLGAACIIVGVATGGIALLFNRLSGNDNGGGGQPGVVSSPLPPTPTLRPTPTAEPIYTGDLALLLPSEADLPAGLVFGSSGSSTNTQVGEVYFGRENGPLLFGSAAEIADRLDEIGRLTSFFASYSDPDGCESTSGFTYAGFTLVMHTSNEAAHEHTALSRSLVLDYEGSTDPFTALGENGDISYTNDDEFCDHGVTIQFTADNLLVAVSSYGVRERLDLDAMQAEAERLAVIILNNLNAALP